MSRSAALNSWASFVLFLAIMFAFRSAIADWNQVPTGSMLPNILAGDRIIVDKIAYDLRLPFTLRRLARWQQPERGDIVTFESPHDDTLLVKRVIGLPGEEVAMQENRLIVNGEAARYEPLDTQSGLEPGYRHDADYVLLREHIGAQSHIVRWRADTRTTGYDDFAVTRVPPDHYLVLGDNRDQSQDSRALGFVHRDRITGRAQTVVFSLDYDNRFTPRRERFWTPLH